MKKFQRDGLKAEQVFYILGSGKWVYVVGSFLEGEGRVGGWKVGWLERNVGNVFREERGVKWRECVVVKRLAELVV